MSLRTRELLAAAGASYADTIGNLRIVSSEPAIFVEDRVEARDPERQKQSLHSLKGASAFRVVRALCDFKPPYGVRKLAEISSTPLGTVSRVVSFLEEEALLTRDQKKQIVAIDCTALLTRWIQDYNVASSNTLRSYIEPKGLSALPAKLEKLSRYAVIGSLAGPGIAPTRLAMIYVEGAEQAAQELELTPTKTGANVWLLEPYNKMVFDHTQMLPSILSPKSEILIAVAPSQVIADLLTSPGRARQEGKAMMEKLKGDENAWRQSV